MCPMPAIQPQTDDLKSAGLRARGNQEPAQPISLSTEVNIMFDVAPCGLAIETTPRISYGPDLLACVFFIHARLTAMMRQSSNAIGMFV